MPTIRTATPSDAKRLSEIAFAAKAYWGYSARAMKLWRNSLTITQRRIASSPTFVACENDQAVGFCMLSVCNRRFELEHLWVLPQRMRRAIGVALLTCATDYAASHGAKGLRIDSDPNAERFYKRCGATRIGSLSAPLPDRRRRVLPVLLLRIKTHRNRVRT
jgi:predicted N-acetyltransferase YhbS